MSKIEELVSLLEETESIEFSKVENKYRIELHLTGWYKPIYGTSVPECIEEAIKFINENK